MRRLAIFALLWLTVGFVTGTATLLAGESLEVTVDGVTYQESDPALVVADGEWTLTLSDPLADGTYDVEARVTDAAGNTITDNTDGELVVDTLEPQRPTVDSLLTSDSSPTITGTVTLEEGETFSVTVDGRTYNEGDGAQDWRQ